MSINNSGEKSRSITVIAASLIMALAVGGGLVKVGAGFAARTDNGITVTGSAKTTATADNAVWTLNVALSSQLVADAVRKVGADVDAVSTYLTNGGIPADALTLGAVSSYANEEWQNAITLVAFFLTALLAISLCAQVMFSSSTNFHKELVHFYKTVSM